MNIGRIISGMIVIVLGALILVDGILGLPTFDAGAIFFEGVNPTFKIVLGFIFLLLAGTLMDKSEKK